MTRVIGILAGGGSLPREIAESILNLGNRVVIVAIEGEVDPLVFNKLEVTFVKWGQVGRIIHIFKENSVKDIIIIGSVRRPNLLKFRTDLGFYKNLFLLLKLIRAGGDDGVLRSVIRVIEGKGFRVLGPKDIAPQLLISDGPVGELRIPPETLEDIKYGFDVIQRLATFDIGQSLVIQGGAVIAIEAAEGTDMMLERIEGFFKTTDQKRILIKGIKPGQELRIDMPTIGPNTIDRAVLAHLSGIIVQSDVTLAAQRELLVSKANEKSIFVAGITPSMNYSNVQKTSTTNYNKSDEDMAVEVLSLLQKDVNCLGVVAIRRHIIALETGEGMSHLLRRTAKLQQWGGWKFRRRGALAVSDKAILSNEDITSVASLGLADIIQVSNNTELTEDQKTFSAKATECGIHYTLRSWH